MQLHSGEARTVHDFVGALSRHLGDEWEVLENPEVLTENRWQCSELLYGRTGLGDETGRVCANRTA